MNKSLIVCCLLLPSACTNESESQKATHVQERRREELGSTVDTITYINNLVSVEVNNLSKLVKPEHELNTLMARNDTVTIVLANRALFFPLGKFSIMSALVAKYSAGFTHQARQDSKDPGIVINDMQQGANAIKFIRIDEDKEAFEDKMVYIVSGKIANDSLSLVDGTTVGMDKQTFLRKYFLSTPRLLMRGGRVVELVSALDGIKHYYRFDNQKLSSIEFTSDYVLD